MNYIILIIGFFLLIKGADIFVDGASAIAKKLGIPPVIVGLTIVSIGTSTPELAVSTISAINGNNEIAIGNVLGSNLFNILMVLGITTIILPLIINKEKMKSDFLINILVTLILFMLTFDNIFRDSNNIISRIDGIILIIICIAYMGFLVIKAKKTNMPKPTEEEKNINVLYKIVLIICGIIGILIGGKLVVDSATNIAYSLGMSGKLVGLTIVAMGTSLPELATSVVAAIKGESDIALGNILGSNIFNILIILGVSSAITPIIVSGNLMIDFIFLILITIFIFVLIFFNTSKKKKLSRFEGAILVALYIGYIVYIVVRN